MTSSAPPPTGSRTEDGSGRRPVGEEGEREGELPQNLEQQFKASDCEVHHERRRQCVGTHRQWVHIEDEEVEGHGQTDGSHQPGVGPGRHLQQGLVL